MRNSTLQVVNVLTWLITYNQRKIKISLNKFYENILQEELNECCSKEQTVFHKNIFLLYIFTIIII